MYRMTRCGDIAIRSFPNERSPGRSSVGRSSILNIIYLGYTGVINTPLHYVRYVARDE